MTTEKPNTVEDFTVGTMVQLHPCTDQWMQGDRFGWIQRIKDGLVHVKMDRSKRMLRCNPEHLMTPGSWKP